MVGRFSILVCALGVVACTELPPAPGNGGAGGGGAEGGNGGTVGGGGSAAGSAGAGGIDSCSVVVPREAKATEPDDRVQDGIAIGEVCATDCVTEDRLDQWSVTSCGGVHKIRLSWDEVNNDLGLSLLDKDESLIVQATAPPTVEFGTEVYFEVSADLTEGEPYLIDVRAEDTNGVAQTYNVVVSPAD